MLSCSLRRVPAPPPYTHTGRNREAHSLEGSLGRAAAPGTPAPLSMWWGVFWKTRATWEASQASPGSRRAARNGERDQPKQRMPSSSCFQTGFLSAGTITYRHIDSVIAKYSPSFKCESKFQNCFQIFSHSKVLFLFPFSSWSYWCCVSDKRLRCGSRRQHLTRRKSESVGCSGQLGELLGDRPWRTAPWDSGGRTTVLKQDCAEPGVPVHQEEFSSCTWSLGIDRWQAEEIYGTYDTTKQNKNLKVCTKKGNHNLLCVSLRMCVHVLGWGTSPPSPCLSQ